MIYFDAGHIGIEMWQEFQGCDAKFRIVMKPGQRRVLPYTAEGRFLDLVQTAKAHYGAKVEHPFLIVKWQFGFKKDYYQTYIK